MAEKRNEGGQDEFCYLIAGNESRRGNFDRAASGIARTSLPAEPSQPEDTVSLSEETVALMQSANDFKANAKSLQTADEMTQYLLDQLR